jgi:putative protein kinase ArgK-like GTPase of G3E family
MFRPEEPDLLERKELLNSLKNIIMNESLKGNSPAISICIDGPWGSGKSWLVKKLNYALARFKRSRMAIAMPSPSGSITITLLNSLASASRRAA